MSASPSEKVESSSKIRAKKKLTPRMKLRLWLESNTVELGTVSFVLLYLLIILCDIALPDLLSVFEVEFECNKSLRDGWQQSFWCIDMGFLSLFLLELAVRFYAWGLFYFKDAFNTIDALIIIGSFAAALIVFPSVFSPEEGDGNNVRSTSQITRLVRIVRVFRLMTAMTKYQKSKANSDVRRKKAKFKKTGSYVERVIDILQRLRKTQPYMESTDDRENISFIIDIIISDQLYAVNLQGAGSDGGVTDEMKGFLAQSGVATDTRKKKKAATDANGADAKEAEEQKRKKRLSTTRHNHFDGASELAWVDQLLNKDEVNAHLVDWHKWDFNMFELERLTNSHPVVVMALHCVQMLDLQDELPINMPNLIKFLTELEAGYKTRKEVPFHNLSHGADCTHGTTYFLMQPQLKQHFTALDLYCLVIGAAMHDFEHPGVSNAFLVNSRHETAILYNDASVLESFHVSRAWRLMLTKGQDPFEGFSKEQYNEARQTIVTCILGTDMKFHFEHLTKFKTRAGAGAFNAPDKKDVRLLLTMCMHAADVSNPAKPWELSKEWTSRVMDEFFKQGDQEAALGLPISPFMDRSKTNIAACQVGFINILIKPFFQEWCQFLGEDAMRDVYANVESNVNTWQEQGEEVLGERLAQIKNPPTGA